MKVGFVGTRKGMNEAQLDYVRKVLVQQKPTEAHHGDLVGSCEQFHKLCLELDIPVVLHPPNSDKHRAFSAKQGGVGIVLEEKTYLKCNKDIVNECDLLIATPDTNEPNTSSHTWKAIRYAREIDKKVVVFMPIVQVMVKSKGNGSGG